jgi:cyclic-di-GMP phosphodiesterase TipF (flagellum assembly factor)
MTVIFHILIALTYVTLGAVVGFVLPQSQAGLEPTVAAFSGGAVLLVSALAHQSLTQYFRGRSITQQLGSVASASDAVQRQLDDARQELRDLRLSINGDDDEDAEDSPRSNQEILSEMRMLRTLLSQLSPESRGKNEKSAPPAKPAPPVLRLEPVLADHAGDPNAPETGGYAIDPVKPKSDYRADWAGPARSGGPMPGGGTVEGKLGMLSPRPAEPTGPQRDPNDVLKTTRDALERARVSLFLQPIVRLPMRRVRYYEAFSRIEDEAGAFLVPGDVRSHNKHYGVFCNVSRNTVQDASFFPQFIDYLSENTELASDLIFEFRQPVVTAEYDDFAENLERLAALGFRFSLDRVSRLDLNVLSLSRRNFRFIKIETDTLLALLNTEDGAAQMARLKDLLAESGITMIVEKLETERQLVELLDHGVDHGQGYLFGEPRESRVHT